ncbi:tail fiber assembly protein [Pseudomonas lini]
MTMKKKYVRVVDGKVDNIFETNNPITEEFPSDQVWVDVTALPKIDYSWNAVNTNGVWTFTDSDPWGQQSALAIQLRSARMPRIERANATLASTALAYKVELGLATPADEAGLLAYKQFFIDMSNVNKQPGYPLTVTWPEVP